VKVALAQLVDRLQALDQGEGAGDDGRRKLAAGGPQSGAIQSRTEVTSSGGANKPIDSVAAFAQAQIVAGY
jgi:hypothetical protein